MGEYEGGFLPRGALERVVSGYLQPQFPDAFRRENLQVVGIDVPARGILNNRRQEVKPRNGQWELLRGSYLVKFGFSLDELLARQNLLWPRMFWRSSLQRVGAIGGSIILLPEQHDDVPDYEQGFMQGEVFGLCEVVNPHGVVIDEDAGLAQLCLHLGGVSTVVTENLKASRLRQFIGPGHIGKKKTIVPERVEVDPQQLPDRSVGWKLTRGTAYTAELDGLLTVPKNAVLTPALHRTDLNSKPGLEFLSRSMCLAEAGYVGGLDITFYPFADGVTLGQNDGLLRLTVEPVVSIEGAEEVGYHGQWQGERYQQDHDIIFGSLRDWGLEGGSELTLEEFATRIGEAGISV